MSCQRDDKLLLKVAWFCSRDLEKFRHGTPLTEITNAVDDGPIFLASTALNANIH